MSKGSETIWVRVSHIWERWFSDLKQNPAQSYFQELNDQCRKGVIAAGLIAGVAFLRHIALDRSMFPEFPELPGLRITLSVLAVIVLLGFIFVPFLRNYSTVLWLIPGGYATFMAAFAAGMTGGSPPYVASYILVIMLYTIVPFPRIVSWAMLAISVSFYFLGSWYTGYEDMSSESQYAKSTLRNSFLIAFVFIYITDRLRYNSYKKSRQLQDEKHKSESLLNQLEEEMEMARRIQDSLLPGKLPEINEISIASVYLPYAKLGGDFFDTHVSENNKEVGFFICDVSGHGVPAAMVASMVKMGMSIWPQYMREPAKVVHLLYENLKTKLSTQFLSGFVCHLDLNTGILRIANAGHLPLIVLHENGDTELLKPKGRVISEYFPPASLDQEVQLQRGDYLILYTDGITEARNAYGKMYEEERLLTAVKTNAGADAKSMIDGILADFKKFTGTGKSVAESDSRNLFSDLGDDVTLLVVRYLPGG